VPSFLTFGERSDLLARWDQERDPWQGMEWMYHDPICEHYWPGLDEKFADYQFLVYDDKADLILGEGRTIPFRWSGNIDDLPDGVDDVLPRAFESGDSPNSLCAILAVVAADSRAKGLSTEILKQMKSIAGRKGLTALAAPVRPSLKHRYPLTPMKQYAGWRREDGLLFDPWLRTHKRLGARFAAICPNSNVFRGSAGEWEEWTGLQFFESGDYLAPGMMNPFQVDLNAGEGTYIEPNIWMIHKV
jgi:hypothetical protein